MKAMHIRKLILIANTPLAKVRDFYCQRIQLKFGRIRLAPHIAGSCLQRPGLGLDLELEGLASLVGTARHLSDNRALLLL